MNHTSPRASSSIEFTGFADLIEDACGVYYRPADRSLLAMKVEAYARESGAGGLLEYYDQLRNHDPSGSELAKLIEAILVHETYFFRELPALVQLVDGPLTDIVRTRGRARVWSAGCASGEEPLTLAMLLEDRKLLDRVEIVGSDISAAAIKRARDGVHPPRSLRDHHPPGIAQRYLTATGAGLAVAPRIQDAVRFTMVNLVDDNAIAALGSFDAILCRNVLIYFHDDGVERVLAALHRALKPEGVLVVGVAESLSRFGDSFVLEEHGGAFFYRGAR